jgi:formylglycine-generating enzyme required for sulfatase activity
MKQLVVKAVKVWLILTVGVSQSLHAQQKDPPQDLQVLNYESIGHPIYYYMVELNKALGVDCYYCHNVSEYGADHPMKTKSREMIRMTESINTQHFGGDDSGPMTCWSCHHGSPIVESQASYAGQSKRPATTTTTGANLNPPMCEIPAGDFQMGAPYPEGLKYVTPVHTVYVSKFYMDKFEVTKGLWDDVYRWAVVHGYQFDHVGSGEGPNHPVHTVNWWDAVKWCNARSEKAGLTPVYYTDSAHTIVYRTGPKNLVGEQVQWDANGYRLPTEAEWEKAARGGLEGHHFPWPSKGPRNADFLHGSNSNYLGSGDIYENQACKTTPVGHFNGSQLPKGRDMANGYGLYDMDGNQWEWCWDYQVNDWYAQPGATQPDTRGPATGKGRILRGGGWDDPPGQARCAWRFRAAGPKVVDWDGGFRCVQLQ